MKYDTRKKIVEKLLKDSLNTEEQHALPNDERVVDVMRSQWDSEGETNPPGIQAKIFGRIGKRIGKNRQARQIRYYRLSLAASVFLLLVFSGLSFLHKKEQPPVFIASSGIRNMQSVVLPDGTAVQLGPGTTLTYPGQFRGKTREVSLDGQAFFDVAPHKGKPFIVHTSRMDVTALGTAFELFSYEIESKIEATLLKGKIRIDLQPETPGTNAPVVLAPDEKLIFDKQNKTVSKEPVDADRYTSWRKRGIVAFENEKLSMIIPRLEQWYGRKIICRKDLAETYRFTFKVREESLERILFIMGETSPIQFQKTEGGDFVLEVK